MTTLYRPVLIESAEQAEALPVGTLAMFPGQPSGAVRVGYGLGWAEAGDDDDSTDHEYVVGWSALVPIEAEEEYSTERAGLAWDNDAIYSSPEDVRRDGWTDPLQRRYTTRWEDA